MPYMLDSPVSFSAGVEDLTYEMTAYGPALDQGFVQVVMIFVPDGM